jgi:hypothetical protein
VTWSSGTAKWWVPTYSSTLSAAVNIGDSTVTLANQPRVGELIVIEPSTANWEQAKVVSFTGTGPYVATCVDFKTAATGTLFQTAQKAHSSSTAVKAANTDDGTHPLGFGHADMAGVVAANKAAAFA